MVVLVDPWTLFSLASVDANALRSYVYNRWVTFESLYPSVIPSNQATGFR